MFSKLLWLIVNWNTLKFEQLLFCRLSPEVFPNRIPTQARPRAPLLYPLPAFVPLMLAAPVFICPSGAGTMSSIRASPLSCSSAHGRHCMNEPEALNQLHSGYLWWWTCVSWMKELEMFQKQTRRAHLLCWVLRYHNFLFFRICGEWYYTLLHWDEG